MFSKRNLVKFGRTPLPSLTSGRARKNDEISGNWRPRDKKGGKWSGGEEREEQLFGAVVLFAAV